MFTLIRALPPAPNRTSYSGNCATTTDEAGKAETVCSDALGRVTSVTDGLGNTTTYAYDALDDLTGVTQGSQTRSFLYDGLGRLLSATTPGSGTTSYSYNSNGDLYQRTDARGITTTYSFDALHRLTQKSYSDGTPTVNFSYGQSSITLGSWSSGGLLNPKGHLTEATTTSGGSVQTALVYSYDPMGRITGFWQCTPYNCGSSMWGMTYNYDLAGDVTRYTHPAGFTVSNTFNLDQQVTQVTSSLNDSTHPGTLASMTYKPWGALATLTNGCAGSGCVQTKETYTYNNRLQPVMIELGTPTNANAKYCLVYNYYASVASFSSCQAPAQGSGDSGNVMGVYYQDNVNSGLSHTTTNTYDAVNRLTQAIAAGNSTYNLTFSYGQYGNMTCVQNASTNGLCPQYSYNADNRIDNSGFTYDADGNLTSDGTDTYKWNGAGELAQVLQGSTVLSTNT